jgi:hypothetical protein
MLTRWALLAMVLCGGCKEQPSAAAEPAVGVAAATVALPAAASAAPLQAPASGASALPAAATERALAAASVTAKTVPASASTGLSTQLSKVGIAATVDGLRALGSTRGALLGAMTKLSGHTDALEAVFDSDTVVNAFMARQDLKDACSDRARLKHMLGYALSSPGARVWVGNEAAVESLAQSKLSQRLRECPAFKALASDARTLAQMSKDSPTLASVVKHKNFKNELAKLQIKQDL